jgi:hypothetical protein
MAGYGHGDGRLADTRQSTTLSEPTNLFEPTALSEPTTLSGDR